VAGGDEGVYCRKCGLKLDVRSDVPAEQREPCPVCGSTVREFRDSGTVEIRVTGGASATVIAAAPKTHVDDVEADRSTEADAVRGHYRATLDWVTLTNGVWMVQVLNESGEVVEGGLGDNAEDALLGVYERLIPPR
jgi:hypothetical protein